jgi:alginate O-acetyltransferase complex protein AlgI
MSFVSLTFWGYFALVLTAYWLLRERRWQNGLLLAASYIFYGWMEPWLSVLLGVSTLIDFFLLRGMQAAPSRARLFLGLSLVFNVGLLALFKYFNFFSADLARVLSAMGLESDRLMVNLLMPMGLSFYTLKKIGYMLDSARGTFQSDETLIDFALYVSFFPQVVAGPIDRPQKLLPQIQSQRMWKSEYFYESWTLLLMGLFKKMVIADSIKVMVDKIFGLESPSLVLIAAGGLAFTLQILADFSGYTDIARGLARLLGFKTSENFSRPYLSLTPTDFWNRWHITLSTWLRDYIFFPVRRRLMKDFPNLPRWLVLSLPPIITMFVSGLWHGTGWNYVVWGIYYGILISIYQLAGFGGDWKPKSLIVLGSAWGIMFSFTLLGWIIFRAPSLAWLGDKLLNAPLHHGRSDLILGLVVLSMAVFYSAPLLIKLLLDKYSKEGWLVSAYHAFATALLIVYFNSASPDFIYFQF